MGKYIKGFLVSCLLFWRAAAGEAAPQIITANGVYLMGENDSPKIAKDAARQEAMRAAVEKAGVYVESYSKTQNMQLTEDDVKVISGAVLKVTDEKAKPELAGDVWRYTVTITAEIDTDHLDLKAMMDKRTELEKLQKERDELKRQNEELLEKYRWARGKEKDTLGTKLENQYGLGVIFDRCVAMIQRGEQHRAIDTLGGVIRDASVIDSPLAYAYYLRGRAYYELNYDSRALEDFGRAHYYRGLIYYDHRQWKDAYAEIKTAWDASDKTNAEMEAALSRAKEKAYPSRRQGALEQVLREVLIGAIRGDYERP